MFPIVFFQGQAWEEQLTASKCLKKPGQGSCMSWPQYIPHVPAFLMVPYGIQDDPTA